MKRNRSKQGVDNKYTMRLKILTSCILLTLTIVQGYAKDTEALRQIEKKRTSLLEEIVKQLERQYAEGSCKLDGVIKAKVRLNELQRNIALDWRQKIQFQSRIVELEKLRLSGIQLLYKKGDPGATIIEVMLAKDRSLAAQEKLLKMGVLEKGATQQDADGKGEQGR